MVPIQGWQGISDESPCPCDGVIARMARIDRPGSLDKICCFPAECICIHYLISPLLSSPLRKYIVFSSAAKKGTMRLKMMLL